VQQLEAELKPLATRLKAAQRAQRDATTAYRGAVPFDKQLFDDHKAKQEAARAAFQAHAAVFAKLKRARTSLYAANAALYGYRYDDTTTSNDRVTITTDDLRSELRAHQLDPSNLPTSRIVIIGVDPGLKTAGTTNLLTFNDGVAAAARYNYYNVLRPPDDSEPDGAASSSTAAATSATATAQPAAPDVLHARPKLSSAKIADQAHIKKRQKKRARLFHKAEHASDAELAASPSL
jgi:hypothetical protein